jgi:hypothetical protein
MDIAIIICSLGFVAMGIFLFADRTIFFFFSSKKYIFGIQYNRNAYV